MVRLDHSRMTCDLHTVQYYPSSDLKFATLLHWNMHQLLMHADCIIVSYVHIRICLLRAGIYDTFLYIFFFFSRTLRACIWC